MCWWNLGNWYLSTYNSYVYKNRFIMMFLQSSTPWAMYVSPLPWESSYSIQELLVSTFPLPWESSLLLNPACRKWGGNKSHLTWAFLPHSWLENQQKLTYTSASQSNFPLLQFHTTFQVIIFQQSSTIVLNSDHYHNSSLRQKYRQGTIICVQITITKAEKTYKHPRELPRQKLPRKSENRLMGKCHRNLQVQLPPCVRVHLVDVISYQQSNQGASH